MAQDPMDSQELAAQHSPAKELDWQVAGWGLGPQEGSTGLWSPWKEWGVYQSPVRMH